MFKGRALGIAFRVTLLQWLVIGGIGDAGHSDGTCTSETCGSIATSELRPNSEECVHHDSEDIIEWVRNNGGYVDPRLKVAGGVYGRGFFATEDIEKNALIVKVPLHLIMRDTKHACFTVARLRDELVQGKCSAFWPYLKFMREVEFDVPDVWSMDELQILDGLPPGNWRMHTSRLVKDCPGMGVDIEMGDPFAARALFMYVTRAGPHGMQPVFDIFNHGYNSTWHFLDDGSGTPAESREKAIGHTFQTLKAIRAGSELFNQFKFGAGAGMETVRDMVNHGVEPEGAPEIFRSYGFVEPAPTLWYFRHEGVKHSFIVQDDQGTVAWLPKPMQYDRFARSAAAVLRNLVLREAAYADAGVTCVFEEQPCTGVNPRRFALAHSYRQAFLLAVRAAGKEASRLAGIEWEAL